jgi:competence protein ComEC
VVYITRTGAKYHTGSCSYLRQSKIEITLGDAIQRGYDPCSRCKPPGLSEE